MKKVGFMVALLALCGLAGGAFGATALDKDTLLVGTESTFRPFEFRDPSGELVGFDVDLVNILAEKIGKKVEFVDMAFDGLIPALLVGKIDIIAAGMSATAERAKRIAFTKSYRITAESKALSVVAKADGEAPKALEDLAGMTVAVQLGTIQDDFMTSIEDQVGLIEIKRYGKTADAMREILLGRVDAGCFDGSVSHQTITNTKDFNGKLKICFYAPMNSNGPALGISKKDPQLVQALNGALEEFMASPEYLELVDKWGLDIKG